METGHPTLLNLTDSPDRQATSTVPELRRCATHSVHFFLPARGRVMARLRAGSLRLMPPLLVLSFVGADAGHACRNSPRGAPTPVVVCNRLPPSARVGLAGSPSLPTPLVTLFAPLHKTYLLLSFLFFTETLLVSLFAICLSPTRHSRRRAISRSWLEGRRVSPNSSAICILAVSRSSLSFGWPHLSLVLYLHLSQQWGQTRLTRRQETLRP